MKKILLLVFVLALLSTTVIVGYIKPVVAQGIIYIRFDGSVDPDTAPILTVDNITYTFTDNISGSIVVEKDNIVIDGAGYTLQGIGWAETGLDLTKRSNITIRKVEINAFHYGIWLYGSSKIDVTGNNITNNHNGIHFAYSSNNTVSENNIEDNSEYAVYMYLSSNNTVYGNAVRGNWYYGIIVDSSSCNRISENIITFSDLGIGLFWSANNNVSKNIIMYTSECAVKLEASNENSISGNDITNNDHGIFLIDSSNDNTVSGNNITNNGEGVRLDLSFNNKFHHNNLIHNTQQVLVSTSGYPNFWDDGYPSGGNYWSDYTGVDADGDGIGDTPYVIDADNRDRYPLKSSAPPEVQVGVKTGDWIKYDYTVTGAPSEMLFPTRIKVEFLSVQDALAKVRVTMNMSDGTELNQTMTVNIATGAGSLYLLSSFVIPANKTTGDSIHISWSRTITIAGETTRTYIGASRTVVYINVSQDGTQVTDYWDKETGIIVEATVALGEMTVTAKATETNMWQSTPFWLQWWFWAITVTGIVVLAGAVYFLKKKKTPTAPPLPTDGTLQNIHRTYSCHSHLQRRLLKTPIH
jgi:parallel beta-helix repeat protein